MASEDLPERTPGQHVCPGSRFSNAKPSLKTYASYTKKVTGNWWAIAKRVACAATSTLHRQGKKLLPFLGFAAIALMTAQVVGFHGRLVPLWIAITLALLVSGIFWFIPRRTFVALFVNTFGWLPVTLGSMSYFFWYSYAKNLDSPGDTFFHAAADVLPVLLLAAVVDVRRSETLESKGLVLPIIAVFLGEVAALNALAFGYTGPEDFAAVASSLVSTTFALVLAVMADLPSNPKEDRETAFSDKTTSTASEGEEAPAIVAADISHQGSSTN